MRVQFESKPYTVITTNKCYSNNKSCLFQDRYQDRTTGFDLSPVLSKRDPHLKEETQEETKMNPSQSHETVSTTNPDYSQEKDMAYYLAKIKAKAAQKSQEIRLAKCISLIT